MPGDIYASMRYRDAHAAIEWRERTFGFERDAVRDPEGNLRRFGTCDPRASR